MIEHIKPIVDSAIGTELAYTQRDHGQEFHSAHEGYGVMAEEFLEASVEVGNTNEWFETLMMVIHHNNHERITDCAERIERYAKLAACEYIQVAAMARKLRLTMEGQKEGETHEQDS